LVACDDYHAVGYDSNTPRGIPLPDGAFGDNPYVVVHDNGKKVTFDMQQGPTVDSSNVTYPDAIILFVKTLLEEKNIETTVTSRHTQMAITNLELALLALHARAAERHAKGILGTRTKTR
jgi:hypothetical protein